MILSTRTKHPKHELIDLSAPGDILWLWRWLVHLAMSLFHSSQNRNHASQLQNRDAEMQSDILELPILFLAVSRKTSCCKWLHNQPQLSSAKWGIIDSNLRVRPYFLLGSWFSIFQVGSVLRQILSLYCKVSANSSRPHSLGLKPNGKGVCFYRKITRKKCTVSWCLCSQNYCVTPTCA